jgi:hypothetical protein
MNVFTIVQNGPINMYTSMHRARAKQPTTSETMTCNMKHRMGHRMGRVSSTVKMFRGIAKRHGATFGATSAIDFCTVGHQGFK